MPWWRRPWFELKIVGVWGSIIGERLCAARRVGSAESPGDKNFAMTGSQHLGIDLDFKQVIAICLRENERRLAPYDTRLIRPRLVPALARLALKLMRSPRLS